MDKLGEMKWQSCTSAGSQPGCDCACQVSGKSINRVRVVNDILYDILYASMRPHMRMHVQLSELYTHARMRHACHRLYCSFSPPWKLDVAKMASYLSVSSSFSVSAPWILTDETAADSVGM